MQSKIGQSKTGHSKTGHGTILTRQKIVLENIVLENIVLGFCLAVAAAMVFGFGGGSASAGGSAAIEVTVEDQDGKPLKDAVAYLVGPAGEALRPVGATSSEDAIMDQVDQDFDPHVLVVPVGSRVVFRNSDNFRHHVFSFSEQKRIDVDLEGEARSEPVVFDKPGPVSLGCNIHDHMLAFIYAVPSPYFSQTGEDGDVKLKDIPPGTYKLRVWHPRGSRFSLAEKNVTVGGKTVTEAFSLKVRPEQRRRKPAAPYSYGADESEG